jgi:hypothetical protein
VKYENSTFQGELSFDISYNISDVEDRQVPYTRTGAMYRPDYIRFKLLTTSRDHNVRLQVEDLLLDTVTIGGKKLKKDGTPGQAETREKLWLFESPKWPDWVMPLVQYAAKELRENS